MDDQVQNVIKGGENWMSMTLGRSSKGVVVWVRTVSLVEEFFSSLAIQQEREKDPLGAAPAAPRPRVAGRGVAANHVAEFIAGDNEYGAPPVPAGVPGEPTTYDLSKFSKGWAPVGDSKLLVYHMTNELEGIYFTLNAIGQGFVTRNGQVNLSFLRFKGISDPAGVRFLIAGPMGRSDARSMAGRVLESSKQLFTDYIAPIDLNFRISSTGI